MKKKFLLIVLTVLFALCLVACGTNDGGTGGGSGGGTQTLQQIEGVTFSDYTTVYDGSEKKIEVAGAIPQGVSVVYENNAKTDAGEYNAKATLSGKNYETLVLNAKLTISKADFSNSITFSDKTETYNGQAKTIAVSGTLPQGTTVTYTCAENKGITNSAADSGVYTITATLTNKNYNTKELTAVLTIKTDVQLTKAILDNVLEIPDAWAYLPTALKKESMAYTTLPVNNFLNAPVNVSSIGKKRVGAELKLVYDFMEDFDLVANIVGVIKGASTAISSAYISFGDKGIAGDAFSYAGNVSGYKISLSYNMATKDTTLLIGNNTVNAELILNGKTGNKQGRIQITGSVAMRYEQTGDDLHIAFETAVKGVGIFREMQLTKKSGVVEGKLYARTGNSKLALNTNVYLRSDSNYTTVISKKRNGNGILTTVTAHLEAYNSRTGEYIGSEIEEDSKVAKFDTLWWNLYDVPGFTKVQADYEVKTDEETGEEYIDTTSDVRINGSATAFASKNVGDLSTRSLSRRYDIEMVKSWYVVKVNDGGKIKYELQEVTIPMIFVQKDQISSFVSDVKDKNSGLFSTNPSLPSLKVVEDAYASGKETYLAMKTDVTTTSISEYIGVKNEFFNSL